MRSTVKLLSNVGSSGLLTPPSARASEPGVSQSPGPGTSEQKVSRRLSGLQDLRLIVNQALLTHRTRDPCVSIRGAVTICDDKTTQTLSRFGRQEEQPFFPTECLRIAQLYRSLLYREPSVAACCLSLVAGHASAAAW